jgi:uncharacterized membrane protein YcaP (DUF421 family)
MLVPFCRTVILYVFIIAAFRLMGKRQVAEMQATEFVITILISAVASVPMQDLNIPLLHGIVPIITLIGAEILLSALSMRSEKIRKALSGSPVEVIQDGVVSQQALRQMRMTLDDLFESLRLKDVFNLQDVQSALVETNGQLSVLLTPEAQAATPQSLGKAAAPSYPMEVLIADGVLREQGLEKTGHNQAWVEKTLRSNGVSRAEEVFLLCADRPGSIILFRKER